jgi:hypothetical protein
MEIANRLNVDGAELAFLRATGTDDNKIHADITG